jgi:hypothetical protein
VLQRVETLPPDREQRSFPPSGHGRATARANIGNRRPVLKPRRRSCFFLAEDRRTNRKPGVSKAHMVPPGKKDALLEGSDANEFELRHAKRKVDAARRLQTERLQGKGTAETAHEHIRAKAYAERGAG